LRTYTEIREGSEKSILLVKRAPAHPKTHKRLPSPLVAVGLNLEKDGSFHVRTAVVMRDSQIKKKKLLSHRSEPYDAGSVSGLASDSGNPNSQRDSRRWIARQKSNTQNISRGGESFNQFDGTTGQIQA
jgi:hypothetical protein